MYILGLSKSTHDHAAALLKDGNIVAAAEEERFNRVKHTNAYPKNAINFCLNQEGIKLKDVDYVAQGFTDDISFKIIDGSVYVETIARSNQNSLEIIRDNNYFFIPHHLSHAASCFRLSGFKKSNILTIDGQGEKETTAFFTGDNNKIERQWDIPIQSLKTNNIDDMVSVGYVYNCVTRLLFGPYVANKNTICTFNEGKTMALASFGEPILDFSEILNILNHENYKLNPRAIMLKFGNLVRKLSQPLSQQHKNLAASLQFALEKSVLNLLKEIYDTTGDKTFCISGGVALNCKMNGELIKQDFVKNIFIQPASNDAGTAIGAALEAYAYLGYKSKYKMEHVYLGPEYSNEEIENILKSSGLKYDFFDDISGITAELLSNGKIIGWFQGRMEFGPRALGNRSILADPTDMETKKKVNSIKGRELWRPFAPSVIEQKANHYFENLMPSSFMLLTFKVKDEKKHEIPAVVHVDGTTRPQTLKKNTNPLFYDLLVKFEKEVNVPLVLNTSFNSANEPIVCTPIDAVKTFLKTGLDYLAIGNFIVEK